GPDLVRAGDQGPDPEVTGRDPRVGESGARAPFDFPRKLPLGKRVQPLTFFVSMDCAHRSLVNSLLASYHQVGGINRIDSGNLPSKGTVTSVCEQLLRLLFPGYHDEEPIPADELEPITGERIATL